MVYFAKWKIVLVLALCGFAVAFSLPNLLAQKDAELLPAWLPHKQVSMGLDLQGGSHLLMEVDVEAVVTERLEALVDSVRVVLRGARLRYTGLGVQGPAVGVFIKDLTRVEEARVLLRDLDTETVAEVGEGGRITLTLTEKAIRDRRISAVEQSIAIEK